MPVLDAETVKTLEYRQLRQHPKYKDICEQSYSNEVGRLCQGIGHGTAGPNKNELRELKSFKLSKMEISQNTA